MTQQVINIGTTPGDSTGDPAHTAFDKANDNFSELYAKGLTEGIWNFDATSTDTTTAPVSGRFKTNSGNYRFATQIAIHGTTIQGIDRTSTLRTLQAGDVVQCQDRLVAAAWCRYLLGSAPVDHTTWFQLNVTYQTDGGVASGNNQEIIFTFTANVSGGGGGGNVSNSGTPTNGQLAQWTDATHIQGIDGSSIYQPLDADLTSLAAASATGAIYYRSAANTWATVTVGSGLSFASGTLDAPLFSSSAKGEVAASGGGTTNFLRADGTWAAPAGGGAPSALVYLTTITATGQTNLDYILGVSDPYDSYEFEFINICNGGGTSTPGGLNAQFQVGGSFQTSSYLSSLGGWPGGGFDSRTAAIVLSGTGATAMGRVGSATAGYNGIVRLHAPRTGIRVSMTVQAQYDSVGSNSIVSGGGWYNAAGPVTGVRFLWQEGMTFPSGQIRVYGKRTS